MVRAGWWCFLLVLASLSLSLSSSASEVVALPAAVAVLSFEQPAEETPVRTTSDWPVDGTAEGESSDGEGELDEDAPDPLFGRAHATRILGVPDDARQTLLPRFSRLTEPEPSGLYRPPRG